MFVMITTSEKLPASELGKFRGWIRVSPPIINRFAGALGLD